MKTFRDFFDHTCKTFWIGSLDKQPEEYCLRYIILPEHKRYAHRVFMTQWIGGNRGFDWVITHNEDIVDLLGDYENYYLYLAL